jgi:hypothetical protein
MLVSYVGTFTERSQHATVFSVEAQLHALVAMGVRPLLGFCADRLRVAGVFLVSIVLFTALGIPLRIRHEG